MMFLEGPMAGLVMARRREEALAEAARHRLVCQVVRREPIWSWTTTQRALFWLGRLFLVLGRWLERQGTRLEGRAADQVL
jgi:hypothetical protein